MHLIKSFYNRDCVVIQCPLAQILFQSNELSLQIKEWLTIMDKCYQ